MTSDELLSALLDMFYHRIDRITLRRQFEARTWRKNETFHDYVHEKVIMANRITIDDEDMVGYLIEGILDRNLRDLAYVHGFNSKESLLTAFGDITLRDRNQDASESTVKIDDANKRKIDKRGQNIKEILLRKKIRMI